MTEVDDRDRKTLVLDCSNTDDMIQKSDQDECDKKGMFYKNKTVVCRLICIKI